MVNPIANAALFQIGWSVCVVGAGRGYPWLGPIIVSGFVALNVRLSSNPSALMRLTLLVGFFGALLDSALAYADILVFSDHPFAPWFCPPWLIALWCLFATTLGNALRWLRGRGWAAALLGGIIGPLSYYAGQNLGALNLGRGAVVSLAVLSALWALIVPLLIGTAERIQGPV